MAVNRGLHSFDNTPQEYANTAAEAQRSNAEQIRLNQEAQRQNQEAQRIAQSNAKLAELQVAISNVREAGPLVTYPTTTVNVTNSITHLSPPVGATNALVRITSGVLEADINNLDDPYVLQASPGSGIPDDYFKVQGGELVTLVMRGAPSATLRILWWSGGSLDGTDAPNEDGFYPPQGMFGTVADVANLPTQPVEGQRFLALNTGNFYVRTNGQWVVSPGLATRQTVFPQAVLPDALMRLVGSESSNVNFKISVEGDQHTFGYDIGDNSGTPLAGRTQYPRSNRAWPEMFGQAMNQIFTGNTFTVLNRGYPGDKVLDGFNRNFDEAGVDLVILQYGFCDAHALLSSTNTVTPVVDYRRTLGLLIEQKQSQGKPVIVMGSPLTPNTNSTVNTRRTHQFNEAAREVAEKYGCLYVEPDELLKSWPFRNMWQNNIYLGSNVTQYLGWRLAAYFGPRGERPTLVGPGSSIDFYDQDHVGGSKATVDVSLISTGTAITVPSTDKLTIFFRNDVPVRAVIDHVNPAASIYYGNTTSYPQLVSLNDLPLGTHVFQPGNNYVQVTAVAGSTTVLRVNFEAPTLQPLLFTPDATYLRKSTLVGISLASYGHGWRSAADLNPRNIIEQGSYFTARIAMGTGTSGLVLLSRPPKPTDQYLLGRGYWMSRSGTGLSVQYFDGNGGNALLYSNPGFFPAGVDATADFGFSNNTSVDVGFYCNGTFLFSTTPDSDKYYPGVITDGRLSVVAASTTNG